MSSRWAEAPRSPETALLWRQELVQLSNLSYRVGPIIFAHGSQAPSFGPNAHLPSLGKDLLEVSAHLPKSQKDRNIKGLAEGRWCFWLPFPIALQKKASQQLRAHLPKCGTRSPPRSLRSKYLPNGEKIQLYITNYTAGPCKLRPPTKDRNSRSGPIPGGSFANIAQ